MSCTRRLSVSVGNPQKHSGNTSSTQSPFPTDFQENSGLGRIGPIPPTHKPSGQIFSSPGAQSAPDIAIRGWARGRAKERRMLFENPQLGLGSGNYIRSANSHPWHKHGCTQHPSVLTAGGPRSSADIRVRLEEPRPVGPTEVLRPSSAAGRSLESSTSAFSKGFVDNKTKRVELIILAARFLGFGWSASPDLGQC